MDLPDARRTIAPVCDTCGLDWARHAAARDERGGDAVGLIDCVALLLADRDAVQ